MVSDTDVFLGVYFFEFPSKEHGDMPNFPISFNFNAQFMANLNYKLCLIGKCPTKSFGHKSLPLAECLA